MKILKLLLYPLAMLYNLGTRVRNYLFDIGQKRSFEFDTTVIAVGNLNAGGSGKTPLVEYLIRLIKESHPVATLSRGYKRETRGFRLAIETDTARSLGDEPFQLFRKFGKEIRVTVGEDRVLAIPTILHEVPETEVILLDDAFQHRSVKAQLNVLVTEYSNPFYEDFVLPFGRLREARTGASRADVIVVTKCPDELPLVKRNEMTLTIQRYARRKPVFFSTIQYNRPLPLGHTQNFTRNVVLVSGIANATSLRVFCFSNYKVVKHFDFPDHHRYSTGDLNAIENYCKDHPEAPSVLTTEKDMVKLLDPALKVLLDHLPWFYLPIQHVFLEDGLKFDDLILKCIANTDKNG